MSGRPSEFSSPLPEVQQQSFYAQLDYWSAHMSNLTAEDQDIVKDDALSELEYLWMQMGNYGDFFMLKGRGIYNVPNFDFNDPEETGEERLEKGFTDRQGTFNGDIGASTGLTFIGDRSDYPPGFYYRFQVPGITVPMSDGSSTSLERWALIKASDCSLVPCHGVEDCFGTYAKPPLKENAENIIRNEASLFELEIHSPDYIDLDAAYKGGYVDAYLKQIEAESGVVATGTSFWAQKLVLSRAEFDGKTRLTTQRNRDYERRWDGQVLGITMLGREDIANQPRGKAPRRYRDHGALAISVSLKPSSCRQALLVPGTVVHIPILGQNAKFEFGSKTA